MNKCQDILKIVRGNGFTLCLQVDALRTDGTPVEDFALQGDEVLTLLRNGASETKTYDRVDNSIFVTFDGTDALGWYGLEMSGEFQGEPWRWCVPKVFQIVETNERAHIPSWTILADDTYIIGCGITMLSAVIHADWAETDTSAPSYIKNKPNLNEYALAADLLATNLRVGTLENTAVKTVAQSFTDSQKSTARDNISAASVAQVNAKQDPISDLSTIRSGAADGTVARGYLNDFSTATHTSPEQVGEVLASVAAKATGAQPRLTPGENITISEDNMISASGGSSDSVLYTPQTLTSSQQEQARENIGAGEDNVFVAEYGVTTRAEILSAYTEGKVVMLVDGGIVYSLSAVGNGDGTGQFNFTSVYNNSSKVIYNNGGWYRASAINLEMLVNKRNTITGNESSATYYPTTKAVADYAEAQGNKVTSLSASSTDTQYPSAKCVANMVAVWGVVSQTQTWTKASDGGYDYVMSNLQYGWIPKMFVDLVTTAGATFNTATGYFELNGLTDISYNEMIDIYSTLTALHSPDTCCVGSKARTVINFPTRLYLTIQNNFSYAFRSSSCERLFTNSEDRPDGRVVVNSSTQMFYGANHLKYAGFLNVSGASVGAFVSQYIFYNCESLEDIRIYGLKGSIDFRYSPRLSVASILYMITNAANTSAITITLHATAYARAIADSDVQAALEAHPTITLASA